MIQRRPTDYVSIVKIVLKFTYEHLWLDIFFLAREEKWREIRIRGGEGRSVELNDPDPPMYRGLRVHGEGALFRD